MVHINGFRARLAAAAALLIAQASVAGAFAINPCNESSPTSLDYMTDRKEYAQGAIRVFAVDTYGEPVCCSAHLIVYVPEQEGPGAACFHVSADSDNDDARRGFSSVNLGAAKARYEPGEGLTLTVPVEYYDAEHDRNSGGSVSFVINQAKVSVEKR
jgi:hypothetical protein